MDFAEILPFFVAVAVLAAAWVPATRGNIWARAVAWGAIIFMFTIMLRAMKGSL